MKKLTASARQSVEVLLNTYSNLCSAESKVGKRDHTFGLTVTNDKNDSDFVAIDCDARIAKQAIKLEKCRIAKALSKYEVVV